MKIKDMKKGLKETTPVVWMLAGIILAFSLVAKNFFSFGNFWNIIRQACPFLILALGETLAILSGGIDLSVGYLMGFCGVVIAMLMKSGLGVGACVLLGILSGGLWGLVNGFLISTFKIPFFIVTYGVGNMVYGLGSLLTGGVSQPALDKSFRFIADGSILGLPFAVIPASLCFLAVLFLIKRTSFGRNMHALGGNKEALFLSGANIKRAQTLIFVSSGLLAGVAGVIFASRSASGHPGYGAGWEFDAIAATIIGGNSFSEGKGSVCKTALGVFFIQILKTGLNMAGASPQSQSFLIGLTVVFAISLDVMIRNKKEGN